MDRSKDGVARRLADAHYSVEPGIVHIVRVLAAPEREADAREPIKLLEVNRDTTADGIRPVYFGPHAASGIFFPSVVIEVTPEEFEGIRGDPSALPNDWRIGDDLPRAAPAVAGQ